MSDKALELYTKHRVWVIDVYLKWLGPNELFCMACHRSVFKKDLALDHIVARSNEPSLRYNPNNFQPICKKCNKEKDNKTIDFRPQNLVQYQKLRIARDWDRLGTRWYIKDEKDRL